MKIIRMIAITGCLAVVIWLCFWVVPTVGIFVSAPSDPLIPENGFALLFFEPGQETEIFSLRMVKTGWSAVVQGWPLIIIGTMIGYPFGELARRKFAVDKTSKEAIQQSREYANDAFAKELNAARMLKEAHALHAELPRLREELAKARNRIKTMTFYEEDMLQNFADLRRRKESIEKELIKARAKIKRLSDKPNCRIGKSVDAGH
jgi:hypothetical protein